MSDSKIARVELFAKGQVDPVAITEFEAESSTQIMALGRSVLFQERRADYAHVFWRGRRMTITRDTGVMGVR